MFIFDDEDKNYACQYVNVNTMAAMPHFTIEGWRTHLRLW